MADRVGKNALPKIQSGFTLVEVLISLGISTIIALAASAILLKTTQLGVQANNEADATEEISQFDFMLHQYVDQAVHVICNCGSGDCTFDQSRAVSENTDACDLGRQFTASTQTPACAPNDPGAEPVSVVLAAFVTETSANPLMSIPNSDCYSPMEWSASIGFQPRGCKRVIQLRYKRASRESVQAGVMRASQPGELELRDVTAYLNGKKQLSNYPIHADASPYRTIAKISNVSVVRCGLTKDPVAEDGRALMSGFHLYSKFKVLNRSIGSSTKATETGISSFNPADEQSYGKGPGIIRRFHGTYHFRNIDQRGRTFGPPRSGACIKDGEPSSDWRVCCSGNLSPTNPRECGASCFDPGVKPSNEGQCCSKMISYATGKCL